NRLITLTFFGHAEAEANYSKPRQGSARPYAKHVSAISVSHDFAGLFPCARNTPLQGIFLG
ncbi:hypothetical protein, partial [Massilia aurea]|uniref:hypothetical protein n=1 Tax=Massilia aurea TaxID=373040 RepID=UPI001C82B969